MSPSAPPGARPATQTSGGTTSAEANSQTSRLDHVRSIVERTRQEQGLPPVVVDDQALERVADVFRSEPLRAAS